MRFLPHRILLLVLLAALPQPAIAGVSEWIDNEGGRIRIIAAPPAADGTVRAVLDIDLKPGWKTYWRDPGESGIPPVIDIAGSDNIEAIEIRFPAPERVDDGYTTWAGYTRSVRLPLVLTQADPDAGSTISAAVFLGVCDNICVPVQAVIEMPVKDEVPALHTAMVEQAFADLPDTPSADFGIDGAALSDDETVLTVTARVPADAKAELFLAAPDGWQFGAPKPVEFVDGKASYTVEVKGGPERGSLSGKPIAAVLKTLSRSVGDTITLP